MLVRKTKALTDLLQKAIEMTAEDSTDRKVLEHYAQSEIDGIPVRALRILQKYTKGSNDITKALQNSSEQKMKTKKKKKEAEEIHEGSSENGPEQGPLIFDWPAPPERNLANERRRNYLISKQIREKYIAPSSSAKYSGSGMRAMSDAAIPLNLIITTLTSFYFGYHVYSIIFGIACATVVFFANAVLIILRLDRQEKKDRLRRGKKYT
eukprot:g2041.t1